MAGGLWGGSHSRHQRRIKGKSFPKTLSKWWRMKQLWWKSTVRWRSLLYTKPVTVCNLNQPEIFKKIVRNTFLKSSHTVRKIHRHEQDWMWWCSTFTPSASFSSLDQKSGQLFRFYKSMWPHKDFWLWMMPIAQQLLSAPCCFVISDRTVSECVNCSPACCIVRMVQEGRWFCAFTNCL